MSNFKKSYLERLHTNDKAAQNNRQSLLCMYEKKLRTSGASISKSGAQTDQETAQHIGGRGRDGNITGERSFVFQKGRWRQVVHKQIDRQSKTGEIRIPPLVFGILDLLNGVGQCVSNDT